MIVLVAMYRGQAGQGDEVEAALRRMKPLVHAHEPGCARYDICRSTEDPDRFLLYEHYLDQAALDAHRETPHFKEIVDGTISPLLATRERFFYDLVGG